MSKTDDEIIVAGAPFPQITAVEALDGFQVLVTWRDRQQVVVDLAPIILSFKVYSPLRTNRTFFESIHVASPFAIAWGADDEIDMHVSTIERLAGEMMDNSSFRDFLSDMNLTRDAAAALLGLSRRTVGYYAERARIPRYIGLACAYLRLDREKAASLPAIPVEHYTTAPLKTVDYRRFTETYGSPMKWVGDDEKDPPPVRPRKRKMV